MLGDESCYDHVGKPESLVT